MCCTAQRSSAHQRPRRERHECSDRQKSSAMQPVPFPLSIVGRDAIDFLVVIQHPSRGSNLLRSELDAVLLSTPNSAENYGELKAQALACQVTRRAP